MAFTHLKCLFNENEPCDALRDDYLKIASFYDAEKKKGRILTVAFIYILCAKNPIIKKI